MCGRAGSEDRVGRELGRVRLAPPPPPPTPPIPSYLEPLLVAVVRRVEPRRKGVQDERAQRNTAERLVERSLQGSIWEGGQSRRGVNLGGESIWENRTRLV